jgi:hypothetical protein
MNWTGSDHSWSRASILINAPKASGVYVIWNTEGCICVGETHDLLGRLLEHHDHPTACMLQCGPPTAFGFELCSVGIRDKKQHMLMLALNPRCASCVS